MEQLLFACSGYVVAQLVVFVTFSDSDDGDYLLLGIVGALAGVVTHLLVRVLGMQVPVVGKRFRTRPPRDGAALSGGKKSPGRTDRDSGYRSALAAFRKPFKRRTRKLEAPGNEERIIETKDGFRVGNHVFARRSEAEDYLYVGNSADSGAAKQERDSTSTPRRFHPPDWRNTKVRNTLAMTVAFVFAVLLLFFA